MSDLAADIRPGTVGNDGRRPLAGLAVAASLLLHGATLALLWPSSDVPAAAGEALVAVVDIVAMEPATDLPIVPGMPEEPKPVMGSDTLAAETPPEPPVDEAPLPTPVEPATQAPPGEPLEPPPDTPVTSGDPLVADQTDPPPPEAMPGTEPAVATTPDPDAAGNVPPQQVSPAPASEPVTAATPPPVEQPVTKPPVAEVDPPITPPRLPAARTKPHRPSRTPPKPASATPVSAATIGGESWGNPAQMAAPAAVAGPSEVVASAPSSTTGSIVQPVAEVRPTPAYPAAARRRNQEGRVVVAVSVDAKGHPVAVDVVESSGIPSLDDAAVTGVRMWRFRPATRDGVPIAARLNVPVRFRLEDD